MRGVKHTRWLCIKTAGARSVEAATSIGVTRPTRISKYRDFFASSSVIYVVIKALETKNFSRNIYVFFFSFFLSFNVIYSEMCATRY